MASASLKQQENISVCSSKDDFEQPILNLLKNVPEVNDYFNVSGKVGQGAFSSVFQAQLKLPSGELSKEQYALKYIIPTSHPQRVYNEVKFLFDLRNSPNIIEIKDCLRRDEHIVLVMSYFPHKHFSESYRDMSIEECRDYMKNLLLAVYQVHSNGIIHRDIKPSNFLYCRKTKRYALVDFGLAQKVDTVPTKPEPVDNYKISPSFVKIQDIRNSSGGLGNRISVSNSSDRCAKPSNEDRKRKTFENQENNMIYKKKLHSNDHSNCKSKRNALKTNSQLVNLHESKDDAPGRGLPGSKSKLEVFHKTSLVCDCFGKGYLCTSCLQRPAAAVTRAGTSGFRPPEVLLQLAHQTTAVDIWAVGVIFLSLLSGRYPFFRASNDITAMGEIIALLGLKAIKSAAESIGKNLLVEPDHDLDIDFRALCTKLQDTNKDIPSPSYPNSAYDLLYKLLNPSPSKRISAYDALQHPFISGKY